MTHFNETNSTEKTRDIRNALYNSGDEHLIKLVGRAFGEFT